ncbi:hypothetical protein HY212_06195 [Candidatus Pacearchaeota archaeon]|nr:hypothetical protein [Candidatus Pacearchaeota archaeon]
MPTRDSIRKKGIQRQLLARFGEVGYTPDNIYRMLVYLELPNPSNPISIKNYARRNNLLVDLDELGIEREKRDVRHYVLKSKLQQIVDGLNISCTAEDLEKAAADLRYLV